MDLLGPLTDKLDAGAFQEMFQDVTQALKLCQVFRMEAVMCYALNQKSKATCKAILEIPLSELKNNSLLCAEGDVQPALMKAAIQLQKDKKQ